MRSAPDRKAGSAKTTPRPDSTTALVLLDSGEVWTNSILIAEKFGKRHADVLRAIENKPCSDEFRQRNFALAEFRRLNFQEATIRDQARLAGFIDVEMATLLALGVLWAWAVIVTTGGAA